LETPAGVTVNACESCPHGSRIQIANMSDFIDICQILELFIVTIRWLDVPIEVEVDLRQNYAADLGFIFNRQWCNFSLTKWTGRGFVSFMEKFHAYKKPQDSIDYGEFNKDGYHGTRQQKANMVKHAIDDVLKMVENIMRKHARSLIDYAIWYRDKAPRDNTYEDLIGVQACHLIVHCNLLAPNTTFTKVLLDDKNDRPKPKRKSKRQRGKQ
jgi:hypothetical protein